MTMDVIGVGGGGGGGHGGPGLPNNFLINPLIPSVSLKGTYGNSVDQDQDQAPRSESAAVVFTGISAET